MTPHEPIRILLVDDDEEARVLTGTFLKRIPSRRFYLDWVSTMDEGMAAIRRRAHDLCLIDYQLAEGSGIDLVRQAREEEIGTPMILLTGKGRWEVDVEAMEAGVSDYLDKSAVSPELLERAIRYALERARSERRSRDLHRRAARFDWVFRGSGLALLLLDLRGRILEANPAFLREMGYPADDLAGRRIEEVVEPGDREAIAAEVADVAAATGADLADSQRRLVRADGSPLWGHTRIGLVRDARGRPDHLLVLVEELSRGA